MDCVTGCSALNSRTSCSCCVFVVLVLSTQRTLEVIGVWIVLFNSLSCRGDAKPGSYTLIITYMLLWKQVVVLNDGFSRSLPTLQSHCFHQLWDGRREGLPATDRAGTALSVRVCMWLVDRADHRAAASCLIDLHTVILNTHKHTQIQARWCRCDICRQQETANGTLSLDVLTRQKHRSLISMTVSLLSDTETCCWKMLFICPDVRKAGMFRKWCTHTLRFPSDGFNIPCYVTFPSQVIEEERENLQYMCWMIWS